MYKKPNHNNFIILLSVFGILMVLVVTLFNFAQPQSLKSRADRAYCEANQDCPLGTACTNGLCLIIKSSVTQTPLAYVEVATLVEAPKPIPALYISPTPTPTIPVLVQISQNINGSVTGFFGLIFRWFGMIAGKVQTIF